MMSSANIDTASKNNKSNGMSKTTVLLMNEGKTLYLEMCFLGYSFEDIEKYITKTFIDCKKAYAKRWTQMKYI